MASPGEVLELIRSERADTRAEIGRLTGLSRTAVAARLKALQGLDLVVEGQATESTGGRPPGRLAFNKDAGVVLAAAIGRSRTQLGLCDLDGAILFAVDVEQEVGAGPDEVMPRVVAGFRGLLEQAGRSVDAVRGFGCSIPGTVDPVRGASIESPLMAGWDGVPLAPYLEPLTSDGVPVLVDNDATVLALSERRGHLERFANLVAVKASTGLGAGIVVDGRLVRGGRCAAGEIGHVKTPAAEGLACRCGDTGCLEAVAGGWALVQALQKQGVQVSHIRHLVTRAVEGDPEARRLVRQSGRWLGEVLAAVVNILNPDALVIGGDMSAAYETLVAGMRETVYANAAALATKDLEILPATHGDQAGLVGCAVLVLEEVLSPRAVDATLRR